MREIKFRAWDSRKKEFPLNLRGVTLTNILFGMAANLFEEGDLIWMQSIGILDRSGNEVFEGDLLKVHYIPEGARAPDIYEVFFEGQEASFLMRRVNPPVGSYESRRPYASHMGDSWQSCYEIIGNIHENPELLNKEKKNDPSRKS